MLESSAGHTPYSSAFSSPVEKEWREALRITEEKSRMRKGLEWRVKEESAHRRTHVKRHQCELERKEEELKSLKHRLKVTSVYGSANYREKWKSIQREYDATVKKLSEAETDNQVIRDKLREAASMASNAEEQNRKSNLTNDSLRQQLELLKSEVWNWKHSITKGASATNVNLKNLIEANNALSRRVATLETLNQKHLSEKYSAEEELLITKRQLATLSSQFKDLSQTNTPVIVKQLPEVTIHGSLYTPRSYSPRPTVKGLSVSSHSSPKVQGRSVRMVFTPQPPSTSQSPDVGNSYNNSTSDNKIRPWCSTLPPGAGQSKSLF